MDIFRIILLCYLSVFCAQIFALDDQDLLPPEQAFKVTAAAIDNELTVVWDIADGYYLYRNKSAIESETPAIQLSEALFPPGKIKNDEFFGAVETYRNQVKVTAAFDNPLQLAELQLRVKHQGCADSGVCYPPQRSNLTVTLPTNKTATANVDPINNLVQGFSGLKLNLFEDELLPPEQAFKFFANIVDGNTLQANWQIADDYYLYREKIELSVVENSNIRLADYVIPRGKPKFDEAFGQVEIFYNELSFNAPLIRRDPGAQTIKLLAKFQGCAERGVCYPPMQKTIELALPVATLASLNPVSIQTNAVKSSEQDQIAFSLAQNTFWLTLASFFGFGLLLAFTPCIFPMIPILSGIIVGHGEKVTVRRGFLLSLCYVLASAVAYTVFGILAALFGSNLQAQLQQPWIIILFSSIFILLALSMFGFYNLELPKFLQAKLHNASDKHRNSGLWGAALMGALSALIVGPCVAAPLAGALIYIGQSGDAILGGSALFMMGFGMGVPLLFLGASAGSILPKAGHWLNATKAVFGVIMLAVAVWMLERVLPTPVTMLLWAMLLILPAIYLSAVDALPEHATGWRKLWKGIGMMMLVYGVLLIIGLATGGSNPLKPLSGIALANDSSHQALDFKRITSVQELEANLQQASAQGKWVMLDYYADWCISCKEMEAYTFTDPAVKQNLASFVLLQADVTKMTADDKALLSRFDLIGPPAILFFDQNRRERPDMRTVGYLKSDKFIAHLQQRHS